MSSAAPAQQVAIQKEKRKPRAAALKLPIIPAREDPFAPNNHHKGQPRAMPLPLPPSSEVALEELEKVCRLGSGSSGKVYKARHVHTGAIYALKIIQEKHDAQVRQQIKREMEILRRALNPHVVRCYGVFDRGGEISFVLEYMDAGSLADVLAAHRRIPEPFLARVAAHCLQGLLYLHKNKIVHRDIKPSNLLINRRREVKIADFGVSKVLDSTLAQCNSYVGTCAYMSPERFNPDAQDGHYDGCSADIWSLGLSLLECAMGRFPCLPPGQKPDWPTLMMAICMGDPPAPPADSSPEFQSFIRACLQKNACLRPSAKHLLTHPFLTKYKEKDCDLSPLLKSLQL
ncbi:hypothetical protein AMTRI_Chr13g121890 [Amborella trichopoda]|uniref:mitogen-activated protein kinase kinase n=1 Tax=Amborella trichopoda TaxID=13333 RepID=U5D660_AMBTC|nr:mitogen-activated protein kinase kinase 9 [Amborella trichopoda]ERN17934.1 hypothetical protein AMTR_s00046p00036960 [Amborella trichopoda]|eukprot:XP_006856467.1 mitogen-activated protein kinase kinase 9 [Amborella trichopoda]